MRALFVNLFGLLNKNKVNSAENTLLSRFISYLGGEGLVQQRPQLRVLPLQAPRLCEEPADVRQRRTGNTGNGRWGQA